MATLSAAQVYQLARGGGFEPDDAVVMTAIAKFESDFDSDAHNDRGRDDSYGLWQINMIGRLGPARRQALGLGSNDELFVPETNARAAHFIHSQQGFDAWSVYANGRYQDFLEQARAARASVEGGGSERSEGGARARADDVTAAAEPAQPVTEDQQPTSVAEFPELRRGSSGEWVTYLQQQLEALGVSPQGVDGDFGRNTSLAVRRFQAAMGLAQPTGVVDTQTWQWIAACRLQGWIADAAETFGIVDDEQESTGPEHYWQAGPTGQQLVAVAQQQVGDRYVYGEEVDLEDQDPDAFDCSELIQWACYQLGVNFPDGSSNQIDAVAAAGLERSVSACTTIVGALLWRQGHVALSLGTGNETVEAKGRKYGVCESEIGNRFARAGLIPGITYPEGS